MIIVKCDHCGKEEPRDQDLFTRVNLYNYEASEKDKKDETEVGYDFLDMHLCPECAKKFMEFYTAFGHLREGNSEEKKDYISSFVD